MRVTLRAKLTAIILGLSLLPIALVSTLSAQGLDDVKTDANILNNESLVAMANVTSAAIHLSAAQESFMTFLLTDNTDPSAQSDMWFALDSFGQFLDDYNNYYSLSVLPHMGAIVTDAGKGHLLNLEETTLGLMGDFRRLFF